jgi:hypothetical protein
MLGALLAAATGTANTPLTVDAINAVPDRAAAAGFIELSKSAAKLDLLLPDTVKCQPRKNLFRLIMGAVAFAGRT